MSADRGRMRLRPDENVQLFRPLDGNPADSTRRTGRKTRVARVCALAGGIVCALVAPAIAHAADPFGTAQITAEVNAAVAQATAVVPQASGTSLAPVNSAKTLDAATKSLEAATKQAEAAVSTATAQAQRQTQTVVAASVPAPAAPAAHPRVKQKPRVTHHSVQTAGRSAARHGWLRPGTGLVAATGGGSARFLPPASAAPVSRHQDSGAPASRATPKPIRPSLPQRPPPLPLPPQPGSAAAGQAGGNGQLTPLVVGALAAVLLIMIFEFLPRTLPLLAFRKPRLVALTPWHPG